MVRDAGQEPLTGSMAKHGSGIGSFTVGHKVPGTAETALTPTGAALTLITLVVGAGVISLPAAVGGAGVVVGFGLIIFCGIIAIDSGRILCNAADIADDSGHEIRSFEDIGYAAAGNVGKGVTIICMQLMYFGIACIFILLIGQYLGLIVDTAAQKNAELCEGIFPLLMKLNGSTFGGWMTVAAAVVIPTLFMWDMTAVSKFAPAGIAGAVGVIFCILVGSIVHIAQGGGFDPDHKTMISPPSIASVSSIFCKAVFSYAGVSAVPAMRYEMAEKDKLKKSVVVAMTAVTTIYVVTCIPAILAFGQPSGTLLADVAKVFLYIGSASVVIHVIVALPIVLNIFFNTCGLTILPFMEKMGVASLGVRFAVLFLAYLVPMVFSQLGGLIDLVSAITIVATMIFLPIVFHFLLVAQKEGSFSKAITKIGILQLVWQVIMLLMGAVAVVEGIKSGFDELQAKPNCPLTSSLLMEI